MHLSHSLLILQMNKYLQIIGPPPNWLLQWTEIITAIFAVAFSALLAILYKRQQKELAANHASILDIADVEWNQDEATIHLSNYGNGVVWNLSLVTLMHIDNGAHRNYALKGVRLENQETQGKLSTAIQDDKEAVEFKAESKVQVPSHPGAPSDWVNASFSKFIRRMKREGASEVKYQHVIRGWELSGKRVTTPLPSLTQKINVESFEHDHSLEDHHDIWYVGGDTFRPYFPISYSDKLKDRIYTKAVRLADSVIPRVSLRPRGLDLSGTKRIRRVLLKQAIRYRIKKVWNGFEAKIRRDTESEGDILVVDDKDEED